LSLRLLLLDIQKSGDERNIRGKSQKQQQEEPHLGRKMKDVDCGSVDVWIL
jgi:hypothetical protein